MKNENDGVVGQFVGLKQDGSEMKSTKLWTENIDVMTIGR